MGSAVKINVKSGGPRPIGKPTHKVSSPIDKAKGYEVVWKHVSALFEALRGCQNPSFIYLIGEADDGPLKIGLSKDPISRLRQMQTGNPRRLRIEYILLGDMVIEKLLHEFWEPFAITSSRSVGKPGAAPGTEWFKPEARATLLPIVETAVAGQMELLAETVEISFTALERIIRDAHIAHDFVAIGRAETRLIARGAGYVLLSRPSRI